MRLATNSSIPFCLSCTILESKSLQFHYCRLNSFDIANSTSKMRAMILTFFLSFFLSVLHGTFSSLNGCNLSRLIEQLGRHKLYDGVGVRKELDESIKAPEQLLHDSWTRLLITNFPFLSSLLLRLLFTHYIYSAKLVLQCSEAS